MNNNKKRKINISRFAGYQKTLCDFVVNHRGLVCDWVVENCLSIKLELPIKGS